MNQSHDLSLFRQTKPKPSAIRAECQTLAAAGVTFVAVHFDGYGDSGVTEEVKCFDSEFYAYEEHKPVTYDAASLEEHFEALVPLAYENDCGGFGDVVLDVGARKITVERNDRAMRFSHGSPIATRRSVTVAHEQALKSRIAFTDRKAGRNCF